MKNSRWIVVLSIGMACLLMAACSLPQMYNRDYQPPERGLIPYLQNEGMVVPSDLGYRVLMEEQSETRYGEKFRRVLLLRVLNAAGEPVLHFSEDMTKLMHLIAVSKDLQSFSHVHPVYKGKGVFEVEMELQHGGDFLFVAEFNPDRKGVTVYKQWVSFESGALSEERRATVPALQRDETYTKTVGGLAFTLTAVPGLNELRAGQMTMLTVAFEDAATGESVGLEPYLGAGGHCVILDEDAEDYVHVHAVEGMSAAGSVMFHTEFPAAGRYKLWTQFQYKGEVLTVPYVVEVR
ncbi:hypothetical protein ACFQZE_20505 [Paenibacillus sp. GCM10027627]|uniref:hypothetical protein n=1 Tax=unclassified Paenibacillus TaxID=185978 RepID=UPI0036420F2B